MKKLTMGLFILISITVSASALSLWIGPNVYYGKAITPDNAESDISNVTFGDLAFGAEGRLYMGPLAGSVSAEYLGGNDFLILTDAGININFLFLRLGLGMGPNFGSSLDGGTTSLGGNIRATAELKLGGIAFGLSWHSMVEFNKDSITDAFKDPYGFLGATMTWRL